VTKPNPLTEFLDRYTDDPVLMVREVLGVEPDPWQAEALTALTTHRRLSIRSGHRVGKTTFLAWAIIWHTLTRFPQRTVATAATEAQLFNALFNETKRWIRALPKNLQDLYDVKSEIITLASAPEDSFFTARTARAEQPEALAGVHSDYVLLLVDESSGVPDAIFEAASGSMAGPHAITILTGNPVRTTGLFYDTHHKLAHLWWTKKVSCVGSPRVSLDYIADMKARYGELSNAYRVRVLGEFPRADDDTIIPFELLEAAVGRDVQTPPTAVRIWGLDPARFGGDASALAKRYGNRVEEPVKTWYGLDLMQLAGRIKAEWDTTAPSERPTEINCDVIGMGAGVVDRLRQLNLPVVGINTAELPAVSGDHFRNLRTELWHTAKEWFASRAVRLPLPKDEDLLEELAGQTYDIAEGTGKIFATPKVKMKKRLGRSPDRADALLLTFAGDAGRLLYGMRSDSRWAEPLRRNIQGIV
jgi:hypothetical protein